MGRLSTRLGNWTLDNPVIPASGTFGYGYEFTQFYDIEILGSIALKGTTLEPRFGNPQPRIAECTSGMINAIGLQNPGVDQVIAAELPQLKKVYHKSVIANVAGFSVAEYVEVTRRFNAVDNIGLIEINVSCPNVHEGGLSFGVDPQRVYEVTQAVTAISRHPVYLKLSPNVTDIVAIAKAAAAGGADGLALINTLIGARFDLKTGKPTIANIMGGFSGPAVKPVALRMVYQVYQACSLPIIGIGGISTAEDVIEFMSAGASAIEVGAANCRDPYTCKQIIEDLPRVMDHYGIKTLSEIIGRSHK